MRFNIWLVVLLAFAPIFILFAGLTAAGGLDSSIGLEITGIVAAAALVVAYLAKRTDDENSAAASGDAATGERRATPERRLDDASTVGYSSPPCQLHEVDPSYLGYSSPAEVLELLNKLLEAERAGARGAREMSSLAQSERTREALQGVAKDEARFCAMLFGHITRLGEVPSRRTGAFHEKLAALQALDDRLELLNRGQGWVVHKLEEAVPKIADDPLRADLREMLDAHQRNIERCTELIDSAVPQA
jgi:nitronate monooxygenase